MGRRTKEHKKLVELQKRKKVIKKFFRKLKIKPISLLPYLQCEFQFDKPVNVIYDYNTEIHDSDIIY